MTGDGKYRLAEQRLWATEGVTPIEEWVTLPGSGRRVRVLVVGDGPPVLFVHGANTSGTSWASLAARLPQFRCLLLDRPGCGLSDPVPHRSDDVATFVSMADGLVADVLDGLDLSSASVVATSLGGQFGLRAAAAHPDRVECLAAIGFPVGAHVDKTPLVMRLGGSKRLGRLMARMPVSRTMARSMLRQIGLGQAVEAGRFGPEAIDWFRSVLNDTDTMRNELDTVPPIMTLRHGMNDGILLDDELLGRIRCPVHFLWGDEDPFGGAGAARAFVPRVPGATLEVLPGMGHAPWMDDPDRLASATAAFLRGDA